MKSILFIFAHPDDAAYGIGGTALLLKDKYDLHMVCATRGERGLKGKGHAETAAIREKEQQAECKLLGAKLTFLDRIDRELFADAETCRKVADIVTTTRPVAVFTIWPVDTHPDHSAVSEITRKALFISQYATELIYFEVAPSQTHLFAPGIYIDISAVIEKKLELIRCHACQNPGDNMVKESLKLTAKNGARVGCKYAEAYQFVPIPGSDRHSILSDMPQARMSC